MTVSHILRGRVWRMYGWAPKSDPVIVPYKGGYDGAVSAASVAAYYRKLARLHGDQGAAIGQSLWRFLLECRLWQAELTAGEPAVLFVCCLTAGYTSAAVNLDIWPGRGFHPCSVADLGWHLKTCILAVKRRFLHICSYSGLNTKRMTATGVTNC
jgi:hypothetical protein